MKYQVSVRAEPVEAGLVPGNPSTSSGRTDKEIQTSKDPINRNQVHQGPGDWLSQTAGASFDKLRANEVPSGLEPAAPNLLEHARTGDTSNASGKRRPARCSESHAAGSIRGTFQWPVRIYWEDTDAGGIVFYANYLKFFERSRTEWLRSLGIEQHRLMHSSGGMFVVVGTSLRYLRPARLDDELIVTANLIEKGRASLIIGQQALLKSEQKAGPESQPLPVLLCEGTIRIGWVDAVTMTPARIPPHLLDSLKN